MRQNCRFTQTTPTHKVCDVCHSVVASPEHHDAPVRRCNVDAPDPAPPPRLESLPRCAFVIPCHNYGRFLGECIESILRQAHPASEIVVVLDTCTDDSHQVAARYPVEIIHTTASDIYLTRRLGALHVSAEIICFLDADDRISENYLVDGLPAFADPAVGAVTGDAQMFGLCEDRWNPPEGRATSGALVRADALRRSGWFFDPRSIRVAGEDWEMWECVKRAGFTIGHAPIVHFYRRHDDNGTLGEHYMNQPWAMRFWQALGKARPRKPRVAYVTPNRSKGGVDVCTLAQMRYARKLAWACQVVNDNGSSGGDVPLEVVDVEQLAGRCDLVYAWGSSPERLAQVRSACGAVPVIYGVHGSGAWAQQNAAAVAPLVDAFWCVSKASLWAVPSQYHGKCRLIRLGADLRELYTDATRDQVRRRWGIDAELTVGFIGRLSAEKNAVAVAQAVALLPRARLVCCSPHAFADWNPYRRQIDALLGDRVIWTDQNRQQMADVYRGIDCLVVSSDEEGGPTVSIEAWATGCPVVSTPVGLIGELEPAHGPLVTRVPLRPSAEQLVRAIGAAVGQQGATLSRRAREVAWYQLGAQAMAHQFEVLATSLVAGGARWPA